MSVMHRICSKDRDTIDKPPHIMRDDRLLALQCETILIKPLQNNTNYTCQAEVSRLT